MLGGLFCASVALCQIRLHHDSLGCLEESVENSCHSCGSVCPGIILITVGAPGGVGSPTMRINICVQPR